MPKLTYKQKEEKAIEYLRSKSISFGNREADDCAIQIFIAGMTDREELYEFTLNEFKQSWLVILKATWDTMYKYISNNKNKK